MSRREGNNMNVSLVSCISVDLPILIKAVNYLTAIVIYHM